MIHNSSKVVLPCKRTVWVISLSTLTLTLTERGNKIWKKLSIFLKTCNKLTKIDIKNIMAKKQKTVKTKYLWNSKKHIQDIPKKALLNWL